MRYRFSSFVSVFQFDKHKGLAAGSNTKTVCVCGGGRGLGGGWRESCLTPPRFSLLWPSSSSRKSQVMNLCNS